MKTTGHEPGALTSPGAFPLRLLTAAEAAKVLRVSARTLRGYCATRLPVVRLGRRRIAILEADLIAFIQANRSGAEKSGNA